MSKKQLFLVLVDSSREMTVALKFACLRAKAVGGSIALLYIIDNSKSSENWLFISDVANHQARDEAERILQIYSDKVYNQIGEFSILFIREGNFEEEFVKIIDEESISIVILGISENESNSCNCTIAQNVGKFKVPITIVPGNLKYKDIEVLS